MNETTDETKIQELKSLKIGKKYSAEIPRPSSWNFPWKGFFLLMLVAVLGAGFWAYWTPGPVSVQVTEVIPIQSDSSPTVLMAGGYVISKTQTVIGPKVAGRLEELLFEEGEHVKRLEVIARLDDAEQKAQKELAIANFEEAKTNLERSRKLLAESIISKSQFDRAKADFQVKKAQGDLAEAQWKNTQIISPIDGIILKKMSEVGEIVNPYLELQSGNEKGIYKLADLNHLQVEVDIPESDIMKIHLSQSVAVRVDAAGDKDYQGEVEEISPVANRQKGTIQVKVKILDVDGSIKPEMSAKLTFLFEKPAEDGMKAKTVK